MTSNPLATATLACFAVSAAGFAWLLWLARREHRDRLAAITTRWDEAA